MLDKELGRLFELEWMQFVEQERHPEQQSNNLPDWQRLIQEVEVEQLRIKCKMRYDFGLHCCKFCIASALSNGC